MRRLPKAIQSLLSNCRGAWVGGIPNQPVPAVLLRLARVAAELGHMPLTAMNPAPVYLQLGMALEQFGLGPRPPGPVQVGVSAV